MKLELTALRVRLLVLCLLAVATQGWSKEAKSLSPHDFSVGQAAFQAMDAGDWAQAETVALTADEKLMPKIVQWLDLQRGNAGHSFEEIAGFVDGNPQWPLLNVLRVRAEDALAGEPDAAVGSWFERHPPITPMAKLRAADLLAAQGHAEESQSAIRAAWIAGDFNPADESQVLARYDGILGTEDHMRRLDRLLWEHKTDAARRMLSRVPSDWRALADARLKLAASAKGAEQAARKVPASLATHPGLIFERVRWLRRKGHDEAAAELMTEQTDLGRPESWWSERQALARAVLQLGEPELAYRLIQGHQLHDLGLSADAEFTAGWIALRFLKQPGQASPHFLKLYQEAKLPITLARAAYWAGRAADGMGDKPAATDWYTKAAQYPTTYYGQLAAEMPGVAPPPKPVPERRASATEAAQFEQKELVRAARILLALGQDDRVKPFLNRLADLAQSPAEFAAAADFAEEIGRPDLGVAISKKASYSNVSLYRAGYPIVWVPRNAGAEQALLLALTRQESAFDVRAMSPSGARGLMQLMPGTAREVAGSIGVSYSVDQLTSDGAYNVTLGQAYFDTLLANFNGSYILSIAAYNAGPGRIQQWIGQFGDPRQPEIDPVDWVESIPFGETRNYVQRVLENLQVYRLRFGDRALAFSLDADLRR